MKKSLTEKIPPWAPVAPVMVTILIYLDVMACRSLFRAFELPFAIGLPLITRLILGIPLTAIGLWFFIWGFAFLKPAAAAGMAKWLRTTGAYAYSRNPMYFGGFTAFWGFAIIFDSLSASLAAAIWTIINMSSVIIWEEKQVERLFGQEYLTYKQKVPRFIPNFFVFFKNNRREA